MAWRRQAAIQAVEAGGDGGMAGKSDGGCKRVWDTWKGRVWLAGGAATEMARNKKNPFHSSSFASVYLYVLMSV